MDARTSGSPLSDPRKEPAAMRSLLGRTNRDWWPNQLSLDILHQQGRTGNPMGDDFDYAKEFKTLDLAAVKRALTALTSSGLPLRLAQTSSLSRGAMQPRAPSATSQRTTR